MKNKILTVLLLAAMLTAPAIANRYNIETAPVDSSLVRVDDLRPVTARVVNLDRETDTVTVETATGFLFAFTGCSDYEIGDYVSAIMHTNGTQGIKDDYFLVVHYSGYSDYADDIG